MMDWQIKSFGRKSVVSGTEFTEGDRVVSIVYADPSPEGGVGRADLLEAEVDGFDLPGTQLGRWTRVFKDDAEEGADAAQQVESAEELLFSLVGSAAEAAADDDGRALAHLLALMLERKRVLKAVGGRPAGGVQRYRHRGQDREIDVPVVDIEPATLVRLRDTFGEIIS